jgi:hypothetical protein
MTSSPEAYPGCEFVVGSSLASEDRRQRASCTVHPGRLEVERDLRARFDGRTRPNGATADAAERRPEVAVHLQCALFEGIAVFGCTDALTAAPRDTTPKLDAA